MLSTNTPMKRKSIGGAPFTPGSNKKIRTEPGSANKTNVQGTPKVKSPFNKAKTPKGTPKAPQSDDSLKGTPQFVKTPKGTPKAPQSDDSLKGTPQFVKTPKGTPQIANTPKGTPHVHALKVAAQMNGGNTPKSGKKGRKSQSPFAVATSPENKVNGSPKNQKMQKFSGTGDLNMSKDSKPASPLKLEGGPINPDKKKNKKAAVVDTSVVKNEPEQLSKSQKKRQVAKLRKRKHITENFATLVENTKKNPESSAELDAKIAEIKSRQELTNTAKRKLATLMRLKKCIDTGEMPTSHKKTETTPENKEASKNATKKRKERRNKKASEAHNKQETENEMWSADAKKAQKLDRKKIVKAPVVTIKTEDKQIIVKKQDKKPKQKQQKVINPPIIKAEESSDIEEEDDDESKSGEESDYDVESTIKVDKIAKKMTDNEDMDEEDGDSGTDEVEEAGSDDEADSDDEAGSDDDSDEADNDEDAIEEKPTPPKKTKLTKQEKKVHQELKKTQTKELVDSMVGKTSGKKTRYVLFVGNLPYDVTSGEIKEHFEKKVPVKHVRLATEKGTNKPRGFGYVELTNEDEYQRAFSFHNTFIKGRRINVLYTQSGSKKGENRKSDIKVKNMKLSAMREKGMLAGSVKESQRRAARRNKRKGLQQKGAPSV